MKTPQKRPAPSLAPGWYASLWSAWHEATFPWWMR